MLDNLLEDLNSRLKSLREPVRRHERLKDRADQLDEIISAERRRLDRLERQLAKERSDVEKLEGARLTAFFHCLTGVREKRLEKERREFLKAQLAHDECQEVLTGLENDRDNVLGKLGELGDLAAEHQRLLAEKEAMVHSIGGSDAMELVRTTDEILGYEIELKELDEAVEAGRLVLIAFDSAKALLMSAKEAGTWDIFFSNPLTSLEKNSAIDRSREQIVWAQHCLRLFEIELRDVGAETDVENIDLRVSRFDQFADWFFDCLLVDWAVNSQISDSIKRMDGAVKDVERCLEHLESRKVETRRLIKEERKRQAAIVEKIESVS
ncbi:MAG: hypothetical protein AB7V06_14080 [Candidatus Obscuribacterales bacterium]